MMEFSIQRDYFITQLNDTLKGISPRATLPILTGIKIDATNEGIVLTGSDSEISIEITIPNQVDGQEIINVVEPGSVVLPGRFFVDIIKKLPGKEVKLSTNEQFQTLITSAHSEFNLSGLDPDQYPLLPQVSSDDALQLPVKVLKNIIAQTNFAVSTSETRPVLTGVNWLIQQNELLCTATDSHRLAVRKLKLEEEIEDKNVIIPGKALAELNKIMTDSEDHIDIFFASNQVLFRVGNVNFISRLLEGHYPDTSRLFPENYEIKLGLNNSDFYHAIDRASLLAREGGNNVIKLSTGDTQIELSSTSPEIGTVKEEVTANDVEGGNLKISFNSKYMMDALKAIDNEEVEVEFFGTMKPFILKPKDDDTVTQLILPIRTY
ncbi:TPA: DNA polymerase III subunit beta [Staphylococcus pseudintermedius]|uniref:DNA polymerase III subunit beta n=1 Tax=Staphylococcus pseudintermedius TaxID=283734 RepID=UPI000E247356|nr:DNA polymerase III subunit beta [Staphylococcus pseudintermedius]EGQ0330357.1 DNA polymerase III subunit beta [Staphylococcus pseudintermedius]EGQ2803686.1 DNA polymerase III subunit beta [Staphylococcus pseudintermedius]EGQ3164926.1 DNA polymerase III subunit beta [Staphylococcus pseudintermedius]EHT1768434.1 DNA polymerase III subunit beta [Staphylococcus pseudintermedius]EHT7728900.1 DNA polymerase III subunit beta [Staphylococcus pseudintermedius]